ncbi:30S ribosomal protein S6 [Candidatus Uhrbacteria bacterium]|nr:30S ribosomal protein S6 [Candidatus Uhrbacteria bacterium]
MVYELLYLTPLLEREPERIAIRDAVTKQIQTAGGAVVTTREIARQRLSYPIRKQQAGEYTLVEFTAPGTELGLLERELRLRADILRLLVTKKIEKARVVGMELEAKERAKEQVEAAKAVVAERAAETTVAATAASPQAIEDLDKKLEEILGKEMV